MSAGIAQSQYPNSAKPVRNILRQALMNESRLTRKEQELIRKSQHNSVTSLILRSNASVDSHSAASPSPSSGLQYMAAIVR